VEVTVLCPVFSFSAVSAGVRSGLGLPCCICVHQNRVTQGRVGVGEAQGGHSQNGLVHCQRAISSGSRDIGLSVRDVEHLVCHAVLIHLNCKTEPGSVSCVIPPRAIKIRQSREVLSVPHVFRAESVRTAQIPIRIRAEILEHSTTQIVGNLSNLSNQFPIGKVNSDRTTRNYFRPVSDRNQAVPTSSDQFQSERQ